MRPRPPDSSARLSGLLAVCGAAAFVLWLCWFHVVDTDFWWHVKAGQILLETKRMIATDPFAYTREGLPYVATHEWLAQILLYGTFATGGALGIILLRWLSAAAALGALVSLDRRSLWPNALLAAGAVLVMRQGLIERPQLFSNVAFAVSLALSLRLLDLCETDDTETRIKRRRLMIALPAVQILWVNLHGGAALLGLIPLGAVFLELLARGRRDTVARSLLLPVGLTGIAMLAALLVSPNHVHTFTYVWALLSDRTVQFIQEWSPHPWSQVLVQQGPFALAAVASLAATRRRPVAVGAILLAFGILSRTASRHEVLFLLACVGCTVYELAWNDRWQATLARLRTRPLLWLPLTLAAFGALILLNLPYRSFLRSRGFLGIGTFEPAQGAYAFLERNRIGGRMFNSYRFGGYLLYRGHPDRKVFMDGRNVDYGYELLSEALAARSDPAAFARLERTYGFTYAVVEYPPLPGASRVDFAFLSKETAWALVYVDDRAAVYLKRTPENALVIAREAYAFVTPEGLLRGTVLERVNDSSTAEAIEAELKRVIEGDARGVRGLRTLAGLYRAAGLTDIAAALDAEAARRSPTKRAD